MPLIITQILKWFVQNPKWILIIIALSFVGYLMVSKNYLEGKVDRQAEKIDQMEETLKDYKKAIADINVALKQKKEAEDDVAAVKNSTQQDSNKINQELSTGRLDSVKNKGGDKKLQAHINTTFQRRMDCIAKKAEKPKETCK